MKKNTDKITPCKIDFFYRPGRSWSDQKIEKFGAELDDIAQDCFRQIPRYQCLTGKKEEFARNVITVARNADGEAIGFCSAVIIEVDGFKNILHLGLTCVKKKARSLGLTHALTSKLIMFYLLRTSPFRSIWITNVACVLSSLGNIALHFENVYPSPFRKKAPSEKHIRIARAVDQAYRHPIAIKEDAVFDEKNFVFRGSVEQTVFQKSSKDTRYYHRNMDLTDFYLKRMSFKNGDEVMQVGQVGLLSYPKYMVKMAVLAVIKATSSPIERLKTGLFSRKL